MDRRAFLGFLGLLAGPRPAKAQSMQGRAKIGALFSTGQAGAAINLDAFRQGMRDLGYVEGRTFVLEMRYADARLERLPELARELVSLRASSTSA